MRDDSTWPCNKKFAHSTGTKPLFPVRIRADLQMKRYVIITSSDYTYGDFLVHQWLRSLEINVDLSIIDVVVIDYGLKPEYVAVLQKHNVNVIKGSGNGHVTTLRFIDAGLFLKHTTYDQILFIDGGDLIFQDDISHLFEQDKDFFRVVKLDMEVMFFEAFIPRFPASFRQHLLRVLKNKPVLNAGVIFSPKHKFLSLCEQMKTLISEKHTYGPDQIIVNYVLYQNKVKLLDKKYNFIFGTEREGFVMRDGKFFRKNGEKIVIAHNAGHDRFLRPIRNFGYGKGYNQLKYGIYVGRRIIFSIFRLVRILQQFLFR